MKKFRPTSAGVRFKTVSDFAEITKSFPEKNLTEKLVTAMNMAKKMNARLAHYKRTLGDNTGSAGANLLKLEQTKERAIMRNSR